MIVLFIEVPLKGPSSIVLIFTVKPFEMTMVQRIITWDSVSIVAVYFYVCLVSPRRISACIECDIDILIISFWDRAENLLRQLAH